MRSLLLTLSSIITAFLLIPAILLALQSSSDDVTTSLPPSHLLNTISRRDVYSTIFLPSEEQWAHDIKCYAIPYGVIGFVSHLWTYWTIVCLIYYRKPYFPFLPISNSRIDPFLAIAQGLGTAVLTGFNISRCKLSWQLVCISAWKMTFSLGLTFTTISAWATKGKADTLADALGGFGSRLVMFLYIVSCVAGFSGLASVELEVGYIPGVLISHENGSATGAKCEIITLAFMSFASFNAVVCGIWRNGESRSPVSRKDVQETGFRAWTAFVWYFMPALGVVFALYSDWILGVIARDVMGLPSTHQVQYWVRSILGSLKDCLVIILTGE